MVQPQLLPSKQRIRITASNSNATRYGADNYLFNSNQLHEPAQINYFVPTIQRPNGRESLIVH